MSLLVGNEGKKSVEVVTMEGREIASWIGGTILAGLGIFESMLASKQEWQEFGESIVHRSEFLFAKPSTVLTVNPTQNSCCRVGRGWKRMKQPLLLSSIL
jgi:hypothetical protein